MRLNDRRSLHTTRSILKASCNHRNLNSAIITGILHSAKDNICFRVSSLADNISSLIYLEQGHIHTTSDIEEHTTRSTDINVQQRTGNSDLRCIDGPCLTFSFTDSHQSGTGSRHNCFHVGEVQVNQARNGDQIADTLDTLPQHIISQPESIGQRSTFIGNL